MHGWLWVQHLLRHLSRCLLLCLLLCFLLCLLLCFLRELLCLLLCLLMLILVLLRQLLQLQLLRVPIQLRILLHSKSRNGGHGRLIADERIVARRSGHLLGSSSGSLVLAMCTQ
jgi:hypothetical protein